MMMSKQEELQKLSKEIASCKQCPLWKTRNNTVPGEGNPDADIVFVGEGPGATEDETGRPFVGRAGKLLDNMIKSMDLDRNDVFILNIVKCRPPGNRKPYDEESEKCKPYLKRQLQILQPKVIVALGGTAVENLCGKGLGITKRHGNWEEYEGVEVMPTFHPSYLLRSPKMKDVAWHDLQKVKEKATKKDE